MRTNRLLIPLALVTPLALASPAMAEDARISVLDFEFKAKVVNVDAGDTVTWSFDGGAHTTTSDGGQSESWNSGPATSPVGATFERTFTKPGRFSYHCIPHQGFMKGAVVVGTDEFKKSQSSFRQVRRGNKITFRFTLAEPAKVVAKLKGPSPRSASRRRLRPGRHSIAFPGLRDGEYKGTVTFTDDYDKKSVVKTSTVVR